MVPSASDPYISHATWRWHPADNKNQNKPGARGERPPSNQKQEERGRSPGKYKRRSVTSAADIAAVRLLVVSCVAICGAHAPGPCLDVRRLRCGAGSLARRQPSEKHESLASHRVASGTQRETNVWIWICKYAQNTDAAGNIQNGFWRGKRKSNERMANPRSIYETGTNECPSCVEQLKRNESAFIFFPHANIHFEFVNIRVNAGGCPRRVRTDSKRDRERFISKRDRRRLSNPRM